MVLRICSGAGACASAADGPSAQLALRILRPQNAPAPLPVIVYIHGAGWVFGSPQTHDRLVRELAVGAGAAVVFPIYRRSPEASYPTALEECYMAAQWVARHGHQHGLNAQRLAVAGDSVGGNMAAAVTLLSRERGGPDIRLQVLFNGSKNVDGRAFDKLENRPTNLQIPLVRQQ
jgi:acetyl esterase